MSHRTPAHMIDALRNKAGAPIAWHSSLAVLLGIVFSVGLGVLLDSVDGGKTVPVSFITGMFLSLLAVAGPFFMALRLVLGVGILMALTAGLAVVAASHAWLAVTGIVILAFVATVWTVIPVVGGLLGTFPTIGYLIILAKGQSFTGGAHPGRVMLAAVAGIVGALLVLLIFSGRDPRKATRTLAAKAWAPDATWDQQGSILTVQRLDSAPRSLVSVTQSAILARIARGWLADNKDTAEYADGLKAQDAIAATVRLRGPIVPRTVDPPIDDAQTAMRAASKAAGKNHEGYAWNRWQGALRYASEVLAGTVAPPKVAFSSVSLTRALLFSVLRPSSASFRFGVQRAVALGVATFIMVRSSAPDFYWVLIAIFAVLQTNASATVSKAVQYAFGTWVGAVAALALALVLPKAVVSLLAIGLLIAGFAWMTRNYMVMCVAMAASIVLLVGSPDGDYLKWAGLRALDVTCGALVAIAVSAFVFRVRPQPDLHVAQARDALQASVEQIGRRLKDPTASTQAILTSEAHFKRATSNLQADIQIMKDSSVAADELSQLSDVNDRILALTSVAFEGGATKQESHAPHAQELFGKAVADLKNQIARIGAATAPGSMPAP